MSSIDALINQRLGTPQNSTKVKELARRSSEGNLTSFSGLFKVTELSAKERMLIEKILEEYCNQAADVQRDLPQLLSLTSEVKAITNQAALLHGERIKQAQAILSRYKEGAFSAWLVASYGNRQTPYNFMLYYDFSMQLSHDLRKKCEMLPRQVVYTLASREVPLDQKKEIIENYAGETKQEMLEIIREKFPLSRDDGRKKEPGQALLLQLTKLYYEYKKIKNEVDAEKNEEIKALLQRLVALSRS